MSKFRHLWTVTKNAAVKNAPVIFTGVGIGGFVTTVVMACKATPKATIMLEEYRRKLAEENPDRAETTYADGEPFMQIVELTPIETVKAVAPAYWPSAAVGVLTITFFILANTVSSRRHAALLAAYELSENTLKEYQSKVIERYGQEEHKKIREEVAQKRLGVSPASSEVIISNDTDMLCQDEISGRYFYSSPEKLKKVENQLNAKLIKENYICVNDFYDEIGLQHTSVGYTLGWCMNAYDKLLELEFIPSYTADDEKLCLVVKCNYEPTYDFRDY